MITRQRRASNLACAIHRRVSVHKRIIRRALGAAVALLLTLISFRYTESPAFRGAGGALDTETYAAVVARLQAGDPYYQALGAELRHGHYPTWPIVNWRTPLHFKVVSALGVSRSGWLLACLSVLFMALGLLAFRSQSIPSRIWGFTALSGGGLLWCFPHPYGALMPEVWAGVLIGVSLGAYHQRWWAASAAVGVLAIFVRELAAPYGVVCGVLAIGARRRNESCVWVVGGLAYAVYYWLHLLHAVGAVLPTDEVSAASWVQWQGLPFVLKTVRCYGWLMIMPPWVAATAVGMIAFALCASAMPPQVRISGITYAVLFLVIGQPFDFYWGFVTAPLWAYVLAHFGREWQGPLPIGGGRG